MDLENNTYYFVTVDNDAIKDLAENIYVESHLYNFTTSVGNTPMTIDFDGTPEGTPTSYEMFVDFVLDATKQSLPGYMVSFKVDDFYNYLTDANNDSVPDHVTNRSGTASMSLVANGIWYSHITSDHYTRFAYDAQGDAVGLYNLTINPAFTLTPDTTVGDALVATFSIPTEPETWSLLDSDLNSVVDKMTRVETWTDQSGLHTKTSNYPLTWVDNTHWIAHWTQEVPFGSTYDSNGRPTTLWINGERSIDWQETIVNGVVATISFTADYNGISVPVFMSLIDSDNDHLPDQGIWNSTSDSFQFKIVDWKFDTNNYPISMTVVIQLSTDPEDVFSGSIIGTSSNPTTIIMPSHFMGNNVVIPDITPPTLVSATPSDNATAVAVYSDIVLTFSETVQAGTGNIVISYGNDICTIDITDSSQVTINGDTVTINPTNDLHSGSSCHVAIDNGAITDLAGNTFAGISDATTFDFTTSNAAPILQRPTGISFAEKVDYATGSTSRSVTTADVNGDGKADLISSSISVLTNNGDGTFADKVDYGMGYGVSSVTSADVNGDGKADIIVANSYNGTVSVLKNNGDGTFATNVDDYSIGSGNDFGMTPVFVTTADINGDDKADIIVAGDTYLFSHTVSVLLNNGNGTFAAKIAYAVGSYPVSVTTADVNGDGKVDLIVANSGNNTVSVLLNKGNGTFSSKVDYDTAYSPESVTTSDVNVDGKADIIVANEGNMVSVLLNNGNGTFAKTINYTTGSHPQSVTTADINGDGKSDIIVSNRERSISVLLNNGEGTFASPVDYATASFPWYITSADVNSDGKADIIITNGDSSLVSVFINTSPSVLTHFIEQTPVAVCNDITITDPDGDASWNGGTLKVQITKNEEATDSLSFTTVNPGGNGIWLDTTGNKLMAGTIQIGTADAISVSNNNTWTFTFNGNATNNLVQEVGRALMFTHNGSSPLAAERTIMFTVTDNLGASSSMAQTMMFNSDFPPTDILLSNTTIPENSQLGTVIGTLNTVDDDLTGIYHYQLLDDAGGRFVLVGDNVQVAEGAILDFESSSSHTIQVRSTDPRGLSFEKEIMIRLSDVGPDLLITKIETPQGVVDVDAGSSLEVSWTLAQSTEPPSSSWIDRIYLDNPDTPGMDRWVGDFPVSAQLSLSEGLNRIQTVQIPTDMQGHFRVVVITDAGNTLNEGTLGETNNTAYGSVTVNVLNTNLQTESVTAPVSAFAGREIEVQYVVKNTGNAPTMSGLWSDYLYLSSDTTLGSTDVWLGSVQNASYLDVGQGYSNTAKVILPTGYMGDYHILVKTDATNKIPEAGAEGDNVAASTLLNIQPIPPTPVTELSDPAVISVAAPSQALSGQNMSLTYIIDNAGFAAIAQSSPVWIERIYMSSNDTRDGSERLLKTISRDLSADQLPLPEKQNHFTTTENVILPVSLAGDFYFFVTVSPVSPVTNAFQSNDIAYDATPTKVNLTPPPDLEVSGLSVSLPAIAGHDLSITYRVINSGLSTTPNSGWNDSLYLSSDTTLNESDAKLADVWHSGNLEPTGTMTTLPLNEAIALYNAGSADGYYVNTVTVQLPDGLQGSFYLLASTDSSNDVFELDNSDNIGASAEPIIIESRPADLVVTDGSAPMAAQAGNSLRVSWTIKNQGVGYSSMTQWRDSVMLSRDAVLGNGDDITLGYFTHTGLLNVGETSSQSELVSLPSYLSGQYQLFVVTDVAHQVYEASQENNNSKLLSGIQILPVTPPITPTPSNPPIQVQSPPDMQVTSVTAAASAASGDWFTVNYTVLNAGLGSTKTWYWWDAVILSKDDIIGNSDDVNLGTLYHSNELAPGQSYQGAGSFELPIDLQGDYQVWVYTDSKGYVAELGGENNNQRVAAGITTISLTPTPDLVISALQAADQGTSGQNLQVDWTVHNNGAATGAGWRQVFYLSRDGILDRATDLYLGFTDSQTALSANADELFSHSFQIPKGLSGKYYLFGVVDSNNAIYERGAEGNNTALDATAVQITLPKPADLVVGVITVPENGIPGAQTSISYTVSNLSEEAVTGQWSDSIYISTDAVWDLGDALFSRVAINGPLAGNASYTQTATGTLPGVIGGDYYVIVRSDIYNQIPESSEVNNLTVSLDTTHIDVELLAFDTPDTASLVTGEAVYYRVDVAEGETLQLNFDRAATEGHTELFVSYGEMPSRSNFDYRYNQADSPDQNLVIDNTREGSYYVMGYNASGSTGDYTMTAKTLQFSITELGTTAGSNKGQVTVRIEGAEFTTQTSAMLIGADGVEHSANHIYWKDSLELWATFDLRGLATGYYDVELQDDTNKALLDDGFTVNNAEQGHIEYSITSPATLRPNEIGTVSVYYQNVGATDVAAPLLTISGDAFLKQIGDNEFGGTSVEFLGISSEGPAGILSPGASNNFKLNFKPLLTGAHEQNFIGISTFDANYVIDWNTLLESSKPEHISQEAWVTVKANLIAELGTTVNDYQNALAQNATVLAMLEDRTNDVNRLFAMEYNQATNNGALYRSDEIGVFGRDHTFRWDITATSQANGDVIVSIAGSQQTFTHLVDGSYKGTDGATLTKNGEGFTCQQQDGKQISFNLDGTFDTILEANGIREQAIYVNHQLSQVTFSNGESQSFTYNDHGRLTQITDQNGVATTFTYDQNGEYQTSVTSAEGTTLYEYVTEAGPAQHQLSAITLPDGTVKHFNYDDQGRLYTESLNEGPATATYHYLGANEVEVTDVNGTTTHLWYNDRGQLAQVEDAARNVNELRYDSTGNFIENVGTLGFLDSNPLTVPEILSDGVAPFDFSRSREPQLMTVNPTIVAVDNPETIGNSITLSAVSSSTTQAAPIQITALSPPKKLDIVIAELTQKLPNGSSVRWPTNELSYTFLTSVPSYYSQIFGSTDSDANIQMTSCSMFTLEQKHAAEKALTLWASVAHLSFNPEVNAIGQITFANNIVPPTKTPEGMDEYTLGATWPLSSGKGEVEGDIWINSSLSDNLNPTVGSKAFKTLLHELGHALGLVHPNNDSSGESYVTTLMRSGESPWYPIKPMVYDIAAIQSLYGANLSYESGDNKYDNFTPVMQAIWDAGGIDTIDASNETKESCYIDLRPGGFSSIGTTQDKPNVSIAYTYNLNGTEYGFIENANGGLRNDKIIGNEKDNVLDGGLNSDTLIGGLGNDTYILDYIGDKVIETSDIATEIDLVKSSITYSLPANVENLILTGDNIINGIGNELDNEITGNSAPNVLYGESGVDTYYAGAGDTIYDSDGKGKVYYDTDHLLTGGTREKGEKLFVSADGLVRYEELSDGGTIIAITPDGIITVGVPSSPMKFGADGETIFSGLPGMEIILITKNTKQPAPPQPPPTPVPKIPGPRTPTENIAPNDPNDIVGPQGFGDEHWISSKNPLQYTIHFENLATATAPAQQVTITQTLDSDLNLSSFRLGDFGWGDFYVTVPDNTSFYINRLDLRSTKGYMVDVVAGVDVATHEAYWSFTTIDPNTGEIPEDPTIGFLPPDIDGMVGQAFANYTIKANADASTGTVIDAKATIIFTTQEPIDTPAISNTLDTQAPESHVEAVANATVESAQFLVRWSGSDVGSAIAGYTVYASDNGGAYTPWLENTTLTEATYAGQPGHSYAFYTVASDNAGNKEAAPALADLTIQVAASAALTDTVLPDITVVALSTDGIYAAGHSLDFSVRFSESLFVDIAALPPVIHMTIGGRAIEAAYQSGNGTDTLIFRHIIADGENNTDGTALGSAMLLNGATLRDVAGNPLVDLSLIPGEGGIPINNAPVVQTALADQSATEDQPFFFQFSSDAFTDVDAGDTLSYTATISNGDPLPGWLSFDHSTRTFSGTPSNGDAGKVSVKVMATDSHNATASDTFDLMVANINDLTGAVTFWKTGEAIADVTSMLASDTMTTGADGLYHHLDMPDGTYALTSAKVSDTAESNAVKANDALAALKIAVGMNPNADGSAVSPYQYLAADVNKDGQVKAADALNILKMAVKLSTAPEKEWLFVPESVGSETMSRTHVVWPDNPIPLTLNADQELDLIGIVKGDVNGSWVA